MAKENLGLNPNENVSKHWKLTRAAKAIPLQRWAKRLFKLPG